MQSFLGTVQPWQAGAACLLIETYWNQLRGLKSNQSSYKRQSWSNNCGVVLYTRLDNQLQWSQVQIPSTEFSVIVLSGPMILCPTLCWQDLQWDSKPERFSSQLLQMGSSLDGPAFNAASWGVIWPRLHCWPQSHHEFYILLLIQSAFPSAI